VTVFPTPVQVTARDLQGNTATDFVGDVTVAIEDNPSGGTLSGTTTLAAVAGVATLPISVSTGPGRATRFVQRRRR
jgi:hypothetical protein